MIRLKDKVCIITGGARGIGKAATLLFTKEGGKVVIADVSTKQGEETASLVKTSGGDATFLQFDITKAAEVVRS